jgi:hypothetical protein
VRFDATGASCVKHDPSLFFPETERNGSEERKSELAMKSINALKICAECPIRQACLDNSFTSIDTINYGIFGGTLPYERREAIGKKSREMNNNTTYYQHTYRKIADEQGVPRHYIKPREVSGQLWHGIYQDEQSA